MPVTPAAANGLGKQERLCGKTTISSLISKGRWGTSAHLKYCWIKREEGELNRILVSVPKKFFKRAVKRNLLKRRMREAYRTQKGLISSKGVDIMFTYSNPEIADSATIREEVAAAMSRINKTLNPEPRECQQEKQ